MLIAIRRSAACVRSALHRVARESVSGDTTIPVKPARLPCPGPESAGLDAAEERRRKLRLRPSAVLGAVCPGGTGWNLSAGNGLAPNADGLLSRLTAGSFVILEPT